MPDSLLLKDTLKSYILDNGPIYIETLHHYHETWVEPWNSVTAAVFILIAMYWTWQIRGQWKTYAFLTYAAPILMIGGIGGTVYHAFRVSDTFLTLDWLPIVILMMSAIFWCLARLLRPWWLAVLVVALFITVVSVAMYFLAPLRETDPEAFQRYAPFVWGFMMTVQIIPVVWWAIRSKRRFADNILIALGAFVLALISRAYDANIVSEIFDAREGIYYLNRLDEFELLHLLHQGTHFLWHSFGAVATAFMFRYFYYLLPDLRQNPQHYTPKQDTDTLTVQ